MPVPRPPPPQFPSPLTPTHVSCVGGGKGRGGGGRGRSGGISKGKGHKGGGPDQAKYKKRELGSNAYKFEKDDGLEDGEDDSVAVLVDDDGLSIFWLLVIAHPFQFNPLPPLTHL